jgi:hypothetical protein
MSEFDEIADAYFRHTRELLTNHPDDLRNFEEMWADGRRRDAYVLVTETTNRLDLTRSAECKKADKAFFWAYMY